MMWLFLCLFLGVILFSAGFFVACLFACGAQAERQMEWTRWCEERCGKRDECADWADGTDD